MCGITGIYSFNDIGKSFLSRTSAAVDTMKLRGPDANGVYTHNRVALGHARLSIIDTSCAAAQPFTDSSGRYTIIFNGEFYNFGLHRKELIEKGIRFRSTSDTEVLLNLYILEKEKCLEKINGFFAFAVYDNAEESLFIARDRYGVKPLLLYSDENKFIFASELKALLAYGIPKELDTVSLYDYLQLNYIPPPYSIYKNITKLTPGSYLVVNKNKFEKKTYYKIPYIKENYTGLSYQSAQVKLVELLDRSVQLRLVSDVPLGAFLSGGIDSSVIVALASRYTNQLNTFSIGYKDEPFFDETRYAKMVADKYKTNHTVFSLTNDDLFANLYQALDYTDEPFADSSALAVHILSMHTRKNVTVALSGDGADELFAGYNKHQAHYRANNGGLLGQVVKAGGPLWKSLPKSRNGKIGNTFRQFDRFSTGLNLSGKERYWQWCSIAGEEYAAGILNCVYSENERRLRKAETLSIIDDRSSINDILYTDMHLVLQGDMLTKVDLMSMANSLEVRTPFLDYNIVDFAFSLPENYKIDAEMRKKILKDAFRTYLPDELYTRGKHGFEVPLLKWLRTELKPLINQKLLNDDFIEAQGIFKPDVIKSMKRSLFGKNPGDISAKTWALLVFQYWWNKYNS